MIDDVLPAELLKRIREDAVLLDSTDSCLKHTEQMSIGTRHDKIVWLHEDDARNGNSGQGQHGCGIAVPAIAEGIMLLKGIAHELNTHLGLSLRVPPWAMLAIYPEGKCDDR